MKKKLLIVPFCIIALSFTGKRQSSFQEKHYRFVWLTKADWETLEAVSTTGKNTTAVVNVETRLNIIHKVQYKHKNVNFSRAQRKKLEEILKKYE